MRNVLHFVSSNQKRISIFVIVLVCRFQSEKIKTLFEINLQINRKNTKEVAKKLQKTFAVWKKKELSAIIVTKGSFKKKHHFCKVFHKSFDSFVCYKWQTTGCWEVGQVLWYWCRTVKKPKTLELDKISKQNYGNQFRNLIIQDFKNWIF